MIIPQYVSRFNLQNFKKLFQPLLKLLQTIKNQIGGNIWAHLHAKIVLSQIKTFYNNETLKNTNTTLGIINEITPWTTNSIHLSTYRWLKRWYIPEDRRWRVGLRNECQLSILGLSWSPIQAFLNSLCHFVN